MILKQLWCLNVERTTTPNKVLVITTKGQLAAACKWIDHSLPALYNQHIDDKIDVTTLKHLTLQCLDKPNLTLASMSYADKLKQCTNYAASTQNAVQFNHPPHSWTTKQPDLTYEPASTRVSVAPALTSNKTQTPPPQTTMQATTNAPFDYQAELKHITYEIENNLKAKFEAAIANVQQAVVNLDKKLKAKLHQHITEMKTMQADKTTQDNHTHDLENIMKQLGYLVDQMSQLIGKPFDPTPFLGIGKS